MINIHCLYSWPHYICVKNVSIFNICIIVSVTRLGDLLDFGQLFKTLWQQLFAQISHILRQFCKGVKIYHFSTDIIYWATFIDIWQFFSGHTDYTYLIWNKNNDTPFASNCVLMRTYLPTYLPTYMPAYLCTWRTWSVASIAYLGIRMTPALRLENSRNLDNSQRNRKTRLLFST